MYKLRNGFESRWVDAMLAWTVAQIIFIIVIVWVVMIIVRVNCIKLFINSLLNISTVCLILLRKYHIMILPLLSSLLSLFRIHRPISPWLGVFTQWWWQNHSLKQLWFGLDLSCWSWRELFIMIIAVFSSYRWRPSFGFFALFDWWKVYVFEHWVLNCSADIWRQDRHSLKLNIIIKIVIIVWYWAISMAV